MKEDRDLLFLQQADNEDLKTLVDILTHDTDGEIRIAEQLINTDAYLYCYPYRLNMMWQEIAGELQRFGGNTLANLCRNEGIRYREILQDVCRKLEVYFCGYESTEEIERHLLEKVCMDSVENMSEEELRKMIQELNIPMKNPHKYMIVAALQMAIRRGGILFTRIAAYITRLISRMLIGRSALMIGSNLLNKVLGTLAGPLGWVITAGWTVYDLASPAYRVTIPGVIQVAYMRMRQTNRVI